MGTLFVGWRGRATLACCDFQLLLQLTNNLLQKSVVVFFRYSHNDESMAKPGAICAVLSALLNQHTYGTPIDREDLVQKTAVEHDGDAKDAIDELVSAEYPYVIVSGDRVKLDNSRFDKLLDHLVLRCNRDPQELKWRCHHYEGWEKHTWWPPRE
jgi:hypothetical protein